MNMLLAQPIYQLPHHLQRQAQAYQASAVGHASRHTRYSHQQHFRSLTVRGADPPDFDKGMWRLETKLLKQQLLTGKTEEQPARPWSMLVPSLDDLRRSDWPKLVKDWPIFWSLVNKWLEYECDTRPRTSVQDLPFDEMKSQYHSQEELEGQLDNNFTLGRMHGNMVVERLEDYHNWYQIRDRQQVLTGIQAIGDRLYELAEAGIPMPRELTYYDHIGDTFMPDLMRPPLYRAPGVEYTPPDPQWERVQRLGHSWGAVDLRAHVEKRAAKKLRAVEWQQERREQFRFTYNEVSMYTDMRMRDDPFTEPLDQSHEEIMEGILRGRPAQTIPEQDPFSVQDLVEDGMTEFIPETDQYLRELGLMVEHESLLPQRPVVHTSEFEAIATAEGPPKDGDSRTKGWNNFYLQPSQQAAGDALDIEGNQPVGWDAEEAPEGSDSSRQQP